MVEHYERIQNLGYSHHNRGVGLGFGGMHAAAPPASLLRQCAQVGDRLTLTLTLALTVTVTVTVTLTPTPTPTPTLTPTARRWVTAGRSRHRSRRPAARPPPTSGGRDSSSSRSRSQPSVL